MNQHEEKEWFAFTQTQMSYGPEYHRRVVAELERNTLMLVAHHKVCVERTKERMPHQEEFIMSRDFVREAADGIYYSFREPEFEQDPDYFSMRVVDFIAEALSVNGCIGSRSFACMAFIADNASTISLCARYLFMSDDSLDFWSRMHGLLEQRNKIQAKDNGSFAASSPC